MKINYTIKIGSVVLATLLTGLVSSCASRETGVVTPINLPKVQHTLAAPESLEGAWIRLRAHLSEGGTITNWWYIKNGKAYQYMDSPTSAGREMVNGHPVSPTSFDGPEEYQDNLGRWHGFASYTYVPTGTTAKLCIKNFGRPETILCRSVSIKLIRTNTFSYPIVDSVSKEPAVITFKSENQGVYEGSLEGCLSPSDGVSAESVQYADSITIFTK